MYLFKKNEQAIMAWHTLQDVCLLLFSLLFAWWLLFAWCKRKEPAVFRLNQDVLLMVFDHLSLVDQTCFSLSCKRYYDLFGHLTQRDEFKFPRLLELKAPLLCVDRPEVERNQLLIQLEDRRWAFCAPCLRLHPRREFTPFALECPAFDRTCHRDAGIADLCPCISLTIRDRAAVIEAIESSPLGYELKGPLKVCVDMQRQHFLLHTCSINTRVDRRLVVETSVEIAIFIDAGEQLWADTTYVSHYHTRGRMENWMEPIFMCPHRDLFQFLASPRYTSFCEVCDCRMHWCPGKSHGKRPITVKVERPLGYLVFADRYWHDSCRFNSRHFSRYQDYWYTCFPQQLIGVPLLILAIVGIMSQVMNKGR
jgi:hypothetical protein